VNVLLLSVFATLAPLLTQEVPSAEEQAALASAVLGGDIDVDIVFFPPRAAAAGVAALPANVADMTPPPPPPPHAAAADTPPPTADAAGGGGAEPAVPIAPPPACGLVRLRAPASVNPAPVDFVIVADVSGSMEGVKARALRRHHLRAPPVVGVPHVACTPRRCRLRAHRTNETRAQTT